MWQANRSIRACLCHRCSNCIGAFGVLAEATRVGFALLYGKIA